MKSNSSSSWRISLCVLAIFCLVEACNASTNSRLRQRGDRFSGQIHTRFMQKLHLHPQFENVTSTHNTYSGNSISLPSSLMTLDRARMLHKIALETSYEFQQSHGHTHQKVSPVSCTRSTQPSPVSSVTFFYPADYGADPTGMKDSTLAFQMLLGNLLNTTRPKRRPMAAGITDLGGSTIDLQGGVYLISQPIVIPPMFGNAHIIDGTLQASAVFPPDRWLIEIGNVDTCQPILPDGQPDQQDSCNEFIDVTGVMLDANFVAAGGVSVSRVMGTTLMNVFVTGFRKIGILVSWGHEVMISNAWLAECYWSDKTKCKGDQSVGIRLDGMDHYISNTIVFDYARVGVEIRKAANILEGVHTWNGGGSGIVVGTRNTTANSVRLIGCYLDYATLDIWNPTDILVESTFFYYGHAILHAGITKKVNGLTFRMNKYNTDQSIVLDGTFNSVRQVSIQEEVDWVKTTKATKSLFQANATEWNMDFKSELLFPTIDHVSYTITSSENFFFSHMARPPNGTSIKVITSSPVNATVHMTVEQGGN